MEVLLAWASGILVAISVYLLLNRNLIRVLFGIILMSTAINIIIFTLGRLSRNQAVFVENPHLKPLDWYANALPQALILTAIVIGFGLAAFVLVLVTRSWQDLGTMDADKLRESEVGDCD